MKRNTRLSIGLLLGLFSCVTPQKISDNLQDRSIDKLSNESKGNLIAFLHLPGNFHTYLFSFTEVKNSIHVHVWDVKKAIIGSKLKKREEVYELNLSMSEIIKAVSSNCISLDSLSLNLPTIDFYIIDNNNTEKRSTFLTPAVIDNSGCSSLKKIYDIIGKYYSGYESL